MQITGRMCSLHEHEGNVPCEHVGLEKELGGMHGTVRREEGKWEFMWVLHPILCLICVCADAWSHRMLLTDAVCDPQVHHNASTVCLLTTTCRQAGTLPSPRSHMNRALSSARAPAAPLVLWQRCVEKGTKMAATHMSAFAVKVCCTEVLQWRDPTLGSQEPKYQQTLHLSPKRWRKGD